MLIGAPSFKKRLLSSGEILSQLNSALSPNLQSPIKDLKYSVREDIWLDLKLNFEISSVEMDSHNNRTHQSLNLACFAALYSFSNTDFFVAFDNVKYFFNFLYQLSFPFSVYIPESYVFPVSFFKDVRNLWTQDATVTVMRGTSYLFSTLAIVNIAYLLHLIRFYRTRRGTEKPKGFLPHFMNVHVYLSTGPFCVPYIALILKYASGSTSVVEVIYLVFIAIVHSIFSILYEASAYKWIPSLNGQGAKSHHGPDITTKFFQCVSAMLFALLEDSRSHALSLGLAIYLTVIYFIIVFRYFIEYPFYSFVLNIVHIGVYTISFFASLSVCLGLALNGANDVLIICLFCVGSVISIPSCYVVTKWRLHNIDMYPVTDLRTEVCVEIKMRILLERILVIEEQEDKVEIQELRVKQAMKELDDVIEGYSKQFKQSLKFNQIWATYLLLCKRNRFFAMTRIQQCLRTTLFVTDVVCIHVRLCGIASYMIDEENDASLLCCEEQVRLERLSSKAMVQSLLAQLRFWNLLIMEEYNYEKLEKLAIEIRSLTETARLALQRLLVINPSSVHYRRLYGQFLLNIVHDEEGAKRFFRVTTELGGSNGFSMTDSRNCIVVVSGEADRVGQILETNNRAAQVLGFPNSMDLVGKNITHVMARPFVAGHSARITNYIFKKEKSLSSVTTQVVLRTSKGLALQGQLQFREYPNFSLQPAISFLGAIVLEEHTGFCIISTKDLIIWEVTQMWQEFFRVDLQMVKNLELSITKYIPEFTREAEGIKRALQESTEYRFNTHPVHTVMYGEVGLNVSYFPSLGEHFLRVELLMESYHAEYNEKEVLFEDGLNAPLSGVSKRVYDMSSVSSTDSENIEGDHDGSEHKQSQNESLSADKKVGYLLKHGLSRSGILLLPRLNFFLSSIVFLLAALCIIGIIVQLLWSALTISRFEASIDLLTVPVRRTITEGSYSAEMYEHIIRGSYFQTPQEVEIEFHRLQNAMKLSHRKTQNLRNVLFDARKGLTSDELRRINNAQVRLINFKGEPMHVNINDAIHLYNMIFTKLINVTMEELPKAQWMFTFLKANRESDVPRVWTKACVNVLDIQSQSAQRVELVEFSFMVVAISLVFASLLVISYPTMYHLLKLKLEVYRVFERLSREETKEIAKCCKWKIEELGGESKRNVEVQDALMHDDSGQVENLNENEGTNQRQVKQKGSRIHVPLRAIFVSRGILCLYALLAITVIYYFGFYLWWRNARNMLFDDMPTRIYQSQLRNWNCRKLAESITHWNDTLQSLWINVDEVKQYENDVKAINEVLYYGDSSWNISTSIFYLRGGEDHFSGDVCNMLDKSPVSLYSHDECRTYHDSVLTRGPYETYLAFLHLSESLRKTYVAQGLNATLPLIRQQRHFADHWIPQVATLFDRWLFDVFKQGFTSASFTRTVGTVFYILVCLLLGIFVFYPMTCKLNKDVEMTRSVLTIIPPSAYEQSTEMKDEVRRLAIRMIQNN
jgi:hypothetical protein